MCPFIRCIAKFYYFLFFGIETDRLRKLSVLKMLRVLLVRMLERKTTAGKMLRREPGMHPPSEVLLAPQSSLSQSKEKVGLLGDGSEKG